ncbi:MAG: glutaredoxin [Saprospiraceae bacterium]|jgi:glutaredoxin
MSFNLTVYVREGCHLCEDLIEGLDLYAQELAYTYDSIDIDADAELVAKYNEAVPVVEHDGNELFRYFFELKTLQRYLTSISIN